MITQNQLDLILGRRSVRVYTPEPVSETAVHKMLEAAMAAPSAMTRDPWRFVTIRHAAKLQELGTALPGGSMLRTAPMAIVVCGDQQAAFENHTGYLLQDCSASIENLLLAAHGLGLGACWVGVYPAEESMRKVKQLLNLPSTIVPVAAIAIGHPGEQLAPRTRYNATYVHNETW